MVNQKAIKELVLAEIAIDKLMAPSMKLAGRGDRDLTEEEDYRIESLHMISSEIKKDMSSEDINTAFDMYSDWIDLNWLTYIIESGDVEAWEEERFSSKHVRKRKDYAKK